MVLATSTEIKITGINLSLWENNEYGFTFSYDNQPIFMNIEGTFDANRKHLGFDTGYDSYFLTKESDWPFSDMILEYSISGTELILKHLQDDIKIVLTSAE